MSAGRVDRFAGLAGAPAHAFASPTPAGVLALAPAATIGGDDEEELDSGTAFDSPEFEARLTELFDDIDDEAFGRMSRAMGRSLETTRITRGMLRQMRVSTGAEEARVVDIWTRGTEGERTRAIDMLVAQLRAKDENLASTLPARRAQAALSELFDQMIGAPERSGRADDEGADEGANAHGLEDEQELEGSDGEEEGEDDDDESDSNSSSSAPAVKAKGPATGARTTYRISRVSGGRAVASATPTGGGAPAAPAGTTPSGAAGTPPRTGGGERRPPRKTV